MPMRYISNVSWHLAWGWAEFRCAALIKLLSVLKLESRIIPMESNQAPCTPVSRASSNGSTEHSAVCVKIQQAAAAQQGELHNASRSIVRLRFCLVPCTMVVRGEKGKETAWQAYQGKITNGRPPIQHVTISGHSLMICRQE